MNLRRWWMRNTNPDYAIAEAIAEAIMADPEIINSLARRIVTEPVEWDQADERWIIHTFGLRVDEEVWLQQGRGGAEYESATVVTDLGSGHYVLAFD